MGGWRFGLGLVLAMGCGQRARTPAAPDEASPDATAYAKQVDEARKWLADVGLEISGGALPVETISEASANAEIARRAATLWPDDRVERLYGVMWLLLGNDVLGVSPAVVRDAMHVGAAEPTVAYYARERIVFIDKEATALLPRDLILTHELVHAYQDQQIPEGVFGRLEAPATIDDLGVAQLAIEGHAQFMGMAAFFNARGIPPDQLTESVFDSGSARISSPGAMMIYEQGALAMLAARRVGGPEGVERLWREPPSTTEQMLHPSKRGFDTPSVVRIPDIPGARRRWEDTIGELMTRLLLTSQLPDDTVVPATIGWDGDRLAWFDTDRGPLLVWRTMWDREVDAQQFVEALRSIATVSTTAYVTQDGAAADFVVVAPPATLDDARRVCEGLQRSTTPDPDGAATTLAAERDYFADLTAQAQVDRGTLHVRDSGVRIPIPKDWQALRLRGMVILRAPMTDGFGDNVIVNTTPNLLDFTLEQVEAETLEQLKDVLQSEVVRHARRKVAGRDAWVAESIGHEAGSTMVLHQLHIVFFTRTHRVAITASARPDRWSTIGPMFEEMIDGMTPAP